MEKLIELEDEGMNLSEVSGRTRLNECDMNEWI